MDKNSKTGIVVIIVLGLIIVALVIELADYIKSNKTTYEYAINGEFYESDNCYVKYDDPYCERKGKELLVDYYYYDKE